MKRKIFYLSSFLTVLFIILFACQKEKSNVVVDETPFNSNSVEKNAVVATASFDGLNDFAQSGFNISTLKGENSTMGACPAVTINFQAPPFSITLDWGTGCTTTDGIVRSGSVTMSLSGLMSEKNNVATMRIENYIVDGMKVSGTTKITYVGPNTGNSWPRYSVISEGKIEFSDKSVVTYRSESVRLQAEGAGTATLTDDVWRTEIHSASGINKDGTKWTAKTTKVMIKKGDCKWYNSGTYVITPEKGEIKTIDFGDGTCDNKATLKVGDKVTEITL
jgi:hypothetical protein